MSKNNTYKKDKNKKNKKLKYQITKLELYDDKTLKTSYFIIITYNNS